MQRLRIGIVLLLKDPWGTEVDALRRALGNEFAFRIPPHVTLISPINVRVDDLPAVLQLVRQTAAIVEPFAVHIGPINTFAPVSPVVMLDVAKEGSEVVHALRRSLHVAMLERKEQWPYVPHVTLNDHVDEETIMHARVALRGYETDVLFDAITVMTEHADHVWRPYADVRLGRPQVIGTGGFAVEITESSRPDPAVLEALDLEPMSSSEVFTARLEGRPVGVLMAETVGRFRLVQLQVLGSERGRGIGTHLVRTAQDRADRLGFPEIVDGTENPLATAFLGRFPGVVPQ